MYDIDDIDGIVNFFLSKCIYIIVCIRKEREKLVGKHILADV